MDFVKLLKELIESIDNLGYGNETKKDVITRKLMLYIKKSFGEDSNYLNDVENIEFDSWDFDNVQSQRDAWRDGRDKLTNLINVMIEDIELSNLSIGELEIVEGADEVMHNKVFIIHGHDEALKQEVARFIEKIGLEAIILHEQANKGKTIIEKFEDSSDVGFAIALLTPDDKVIKVNDDGEEVTFFRARQNVIFEMGFFIGAIGRASVFPLVKGDKIEIPSDYSGVVYTKYNAGSWKIDLIKELKSVGYNCDANKAF